MDKKVSSSSIMLTTREKFLFYLGAGAGSLVVASALPSPALSQVLVSDPLLEVSALKAIVERTIHNALALKAVIGTINVLYEMYYEHKNLLQAAWPEVVKNLKVFNKSWGHQNWLQASLKNWMTAYEGPLPADYVSKNQMDAFLIENANSLLHYSTTAMGAWLHVQIHTQKFMQKMDNAITNNQDTARAADTRKDILKTATAATQINSRICQAQLSLTSTTVNQLSSIYGAIAQQQATSLKEHAGNQAALKKLQNITHWSKGLNLPVTTAAHTAALIQQTISVPIITSLSSGQ